MKKKVMNIAFPWPKDDITKAWSGSAYQILCQLEKDYRVNIIDTTLPLGLKRMVNFVGKMGFRGLAKILSIHWMTKNVNKKMVPGDLVTFDPIINKTGKTYWYSDSCFRYLYQLASSDPEAFAYTNFSYTKADLFILSVFQDRFFLKCEKLFVMGKYLKVFFDTNYEKEVNEKVVYVGGGINIPDTESHLSIEKENSFLFVGKDFIRKGGDLVISAFEIVRKKLPYTKLYIIGPNVQPKEENGICYLGQLSFQETKKYFERSKVFVMPSRFEAYGLVFLEALASGCIIIGQNKFEMSNFITEKNGYFCRLSSQDIAEKMIKAMENEMLSNEIQNNRNMIKKDNSWDAVYKRMSL